MQGVEVDYQRTRSDIFLLKIVKMLTELKKLEIE